VKSNFGKPNCFFHSLILELSFANCSPFADFFDFFHSFGKKFLFSLNPSFLAFSTVTDRSFRNCRAAAEQAWRRLKRRQLLLQTFSPSSSLIIFEIRVDIHSGCARLIFLDRAFA